MGGLEQGHRAADVGARRDADAAHFRRQGVGNVVAVQVQSGDHAVIRGTHQNLLQEGVGDHVLDDDVLAGTRVLHHVPGAAVQGLGAVALHRQLITPVLKRTLGVLHDVAFVHQGDRILVIVDGELDRLAHQALAALAGNRLDADAAAFREADLGDTHLLAQEADQLGGFGAVGRPLDAGVNVLGVLAEDHHVGELRVTYRAGHALEPAHRTHAGVQVQLLAQGHVQRPDAAAHRGGQRALDAHGVFPQGLQGFFRHPGVRAVNLGGFFTGVDFHPGDATFGAVGFFYSGGNHFHHHRRDIDADAVPFNVRNNRVVGDIQG